MAALEREIAQFVGKPDALVLATGFATNAGAMPALAWGGVDVAADSSDKKESTGKGVLLISDALNH